MMVLPPRDCTNQPYTQNQPYTLHSVEPEISMHIILHQNCNLEYLSHFNENTLKKEIAFVHLQYHSQVSINVCDHVILKDTQEKYIWGSEAVEEQIHSETPKENKQ